MITPFRDKQESRRCANSWCQTPVRSLSQYTLSERFLFGFIMSGLSLVHCKKLIMCLTGFSCKAFGSLENHAHW
jgi:hypothetical protein